MLNDMDCCTATAFVCEAILLLWSSTKCSKNCFCSSFRVRNELNSCTGKIVRLYSARSFAILTEWTSSLAFMYWSSCLRYARAAIEKYLTGQEYWQIMSLMWWQNLEDNCYFRVCSDPSFPSRATQRMQVLPDVMTSTVNDTANGC